MVDDFNRVLNENENEMRAQMQELLGQVGFDPTQISTVMSGMDVVQGFSIDLGELSDDEQAQLSLHSSPMMAMLLLEMDRKSSHFEEENYSLFGELLGEIIRATYQVGKIKGRNDRDLILD